MLLKSQLIELFKDDTILQYELNVRLLDSQGQKKKRELVLGLQRKSFQFFSLSFYRPAEQRGQMKCPALDTICQDLSGALLPVF